MPDILLNNDILIYTPASIIRIFNNAISVKDEKKIITVSGIYDKSGNKSYDGYYYDKLKDEGGSYYLTVITHQLKREKIEDKKVVKFTGYISRGLTNEGHIRINVHLENILEQQVSNFTEEDLKKIQIQKQKSDLGYKDVDSLIKKKIFNSQVVNIGIITGQTGQIDNDIRTSLGAAVQYFKLLFRKANLNSVTAITTELKSIDGDNSFDLIVIARGGGPGLEYFENSSLCQATLSINKPIISAIGHEPDKTLFEKISDKSFITPTAFGFYLKEITENFINELKNSSAKIIEDTKKLIGKQYEEKIKNLQDLNNKQKEQGELEKKNFTELLKNYKDTLQQKEVAIKNLENIKGKSKYPVLWVIFGIIIGLLISLLFWSINK